MPSVAIAYNDARASARHDRPPWSLRVDCELRQRGEEISRRLGHDQPTGHPYDLAATRFAHGVGQASGGRVRVTVYSAAQLADWPEQSEGVHLGTLDLALAAVSHASQFCKELGLFGARYLFQNQVLWIPRMVMAGLSP